jgi:hypothetical protein
MDDDFDRTRRLPAITSDPDDRVKVIHVGIGVRLPWVRCRENGPIVGGSDIGVLVVAVARGGPALLATVLRTLVYSGDGSGNVFSSRSHLDTVCLETRSVHHLRQITPTYSLCPAAGRAGAGKIPPELRRDALRATGTVGSGTSSRMWT